MKTSLKRELLDHGATIVGIAGMSGYLSGEIAHLDRAVSIGVDRKLNEDTIALLIKLQKRAVRFLKARGHKALAIPPDSDRKKDSFISKLYSLFNHKMAATSAGLGWIGKNGLLINPDFGPRLSLATVLTNARLRPDDPVDSCLCGSCALCVEHCPSRAITGAEWSRSNPFMEVVKLGACRDHKKSKRQTAGKPNCGLCINICPYGRKDTASRSAESGVRSKDK